MVLHCIFCFSLCRVAADVVSKELIWKINAKLPHVFQLKVQVTRPFGVTSHGGTNDGCISGAVVSAMGAKI